MSMFFGTVGFVSSHLLCEVLVIDFVVTFCLGTREAIEMKRHAKHAFDFSS